MKALHEIFDMYKNCFKVQHSTHGDSGVVAIYAVLSLCLCQQNIYIFRTNAQCERWHHVNKLQTVNI